MANKKKNIKNHVQKYRVWNGLLQADLAEATGIPMSTLRLIEKNLVCPRAGATQKLLDFFNVSYDQLFYKDELVKVPMEDVDRAKDRNKILTMRRLP